MTEGYWHANYWCTDYWHEDYWQDYGVPVPSSGSRKTRWFMYNHMMGWLWDTLS